MPLQLKGLFAQSRVSTMLALIIILALLGALCSISLAQLLVRSLSLSELSALRLFQVAQSIGLFIFPSLSVSYLCSTDWVKFLALKTKLSWTMIVSAIIVMLLLIPVINYLAELNSAIQLSEKIDAWMKQYEESANDVTEKFLQDLSWTGFLINVVIMAVLAALGEELFFRGMLQGFFIRWFDNKHFAVWLAAFLFSAFHLQFYGFIPRLLLGAYFGYLLVWSRSLWLPVLAHFINNFTIILFYYLYKKSYFPYDMDEFGLNETFFVTIINALLIIALLIFQYKKRVKPIKTQ